MKKERPILFSTPMVQARLNGTKTMTRRTKGLDKINENPDDWQFEWADFYLKKPYTFTQKSTVNEKSLVERNFNQEQINCPFGMIGDVLWVKETFNISPNDQLTPDEKNNCIPHEGNPEEYSIVYKASSKENTHPDHPEWGKKKWKPSLFMPKSAARIFLEITDIRVERLQSIPEQDAINEGIEPCGTHGYKNYLSKTEMLCKLNPIESFKTLWQSINGVESWDKNPFVWVLQFKRIK